LLLGRIFDGHVLLSLLSIFLRYPPVPLSTSRDPRGVEGFRFSRVNGSSQQNVGAVTLNAAVLILRLNPAMYSFMQFRASWSICLENVTFQTPRSLGHPT